MVSCNTQEPARGPQLPRFYAGREILITGATGFMGKVLVERILSTCPGVRRLHLLLRDKRGQPADKRVELLTQSKVFDNIRAECPSQLNKLVPVSGDVTEPRLGLDENAIAELREVSLVFHSAATTKFHAPLHEAVPQNILSAIYVMDLCDLLPNLEVLVHVSTGFSNIERSHVEERVYEPQAKLQDVLDMLKNYPREKLDSITPKLIHPKTNTYLFTKSLAEVAVAQRVKRHYAVAIFRPTIVISSHRAPFPGWVEGVSGMTGVVVSGGQGLLRVTRVDERCVADVVPVDVAVDCMLAVGWEVATDKPVDARVYYCGSHEHPLLWGEIHASLHRAARRHPTREVMYYPGFWGIRNRFLYSTMEFFLQTVPLYIAGYSATLLGVKQPISLVTIARRLSTMSTVQGVISCREWSFECDNMRHLRNKLLPTDGQLFYLDVRDMNWEEHMLNFHRGARRYILKQSDETIVRDNQRMRRLLLIHRVVQLLLMFASFQLLRKMAPKIAWLIKIYTQRHLVSK